MCLHGTPTRAATGHRDGMAIYLLQPRGAAIIAWIHQYFAASVWVCHTGAHASDRASERKQKKKAVTEVLCAYAYSVKCTNCRYRKYELLVLSWCTYVRGHTYDMRVWDSELTKRSWLPHNHSIIIRAARRVINRERLGAWLSLILFVRADLVIIAKFNHLYQLINSCVHL